MSVIYKNYNGDGYLYWILYIQVEKGDKKSE